jgi:ribosomal protein S18 acetylase RimI-like enzyme
MWANVDSASITIRPLNHGDRGWVDDLLTQSWGSARIVSRGVVHDAGALPGFAAELAGERAGLVTYRIEGSGCEIVSLDSLVERRGVGSRLLEAVVEAARAARCERIWLITTNDNLHALGFYQRRGFELAALHRGAIAHSRQLKPSISLVGMDRIPIRDELELELRL